MQTHISTTPFGGRPLTRAMMDAQADAGRVGPDTIAHKWRVWRNLAIAKDRLCVSDRALAVLNALLSFHQSAALQGGNDLVVFPSNRELSLRAHGMAPATLRRHLACLVVTGLGIRRDSPNGKRYARRGEGGQVDQAFGFDLAPLVSRAAEFEILAEAVTADVRACALLRERITILRRDIGKSIELGLEEDAQSADWLGMTVRLAELSQGLLRKLGKPDLEIRASNLARLHDDVAKALIRKTNSKKNDAKESQSGRHIQNSNTDSHDLEPVLHVSRGLASETEPARPKPLKIYPLGMVMDACPSVADWTTLSIQNWGDFVKAASIVRGALGISPSAWEEAAGAMGEVEASVCIAAILERSDVIKSPGGYLRALTDRAREGQFSLGPVLMALLRTKMKGRKLATG